MKRISRKRLLKEMLEKINNLEERLSTATDTYEIEVLNDIINGYRKEYNIIATARYRR